MKDFPCLVSSPAPAWRPPAARVPSSAGPATTRSTRQSVLWHGERRWRKTARVQMVGLYTKPARLVEAQRPMAAEAAMGDYLVYEKMARKPGIDPEGPQEVCEHCCQGREEEVTQKHPGQSPQPPCPTLLSSCVYTWKNLHRVLSYGRAPDASGEPAWHHAGLCYPW